MTPAWANQLPLGNPKGNIASDGKLPSSKRETCVLEYIILLLSDDWLQLLIQQNGCEQFFFASAANMMLVKGPGLTALGIELCVSPQQRGKGSWLQAVLIRFQ